RIFIDLQTMPPDAATFPYPIAKPYFGSCRSDQWASIWLEQGYENFGPLFEEFLGGRGRTAFWFGPVMRCHANILRERGAIVANADEVKPMLLSAADVQPGDVLLCNSGSYSDFSQRRVEDATGSPYVHAAIFVGDDKVAESTTGGVQQVSLAELLKRYAH